jgi:preprotein translocase subunit SecG
VPSGQGPLLFLLWCLTFLFFSIKLLLLVKKKKKQKEKKRKELSIADNFIEKSPKDTSLDLINV